MAVKYAAIAPECRMFGRVALMTTRSKQEMTPRIRSGYRSEKVSTTHLSVLDQNVSGERRQHEQWEEG
jgi:hypothetical protein